MLPATLGRRAQVRTAFYSTMCYIYLPQLLRRNGVPSSNLPISTTDDALHSELKDALSSSPELQVDYAKLPPTTPRDSVLNSSEIANVENK